MTSVHSPSPSWKDLSDVAGAMPDWLPRVALAEYCSIGVLVVAAASADVVMPPGSGPRLLSMMDGAGFLLEPGAEMVAGARVLRPEVREVMLAELEQSEPAVAEVRRELLAAGLATPADGLGPQLTKWAVDAGDWASLETIWVTHPAADLVLDPGTRGVFAGVPPDIRAALPALSFAQAMAAAYDPTLDRVDLDSLIAALIREGRTRHMHWDRDLSAEGQVMGGTIRMLAQATIPESAQDPDLVGPAATYEAVSRVIREASLSGGEVTARALTFFHSTASLVAILRGDWARARREGEFAMILSDLCSFPGFLAALVVASSNAVSGDTQHPSLAEKFLASHAAHGCQAGAWVEPSFHLVRAEAAIRDLDRELAEHHLGLHAAEATANRWFNVAPMHATVTSTAAILWGDPQQGLAHFDSIVADAGRELEHGKPWGALLLRCRTELLLSLGAVNRAKQIVDDLLVNAGGYVSAVPAARFFLLSGDNARALEKADEGIFELRISLADRAFLYTVKSAALLQAGANDELVASVAAAACVVCEEADTLVPFAALPSGVRNDLLAEHERHHGGTDCFVSRARLRGAFEGLRDSLVDSPGLVRLTRREEVLLPLLATSLTVQEIANQQYVSINTVRKQVVAMREKLGAASRADLIRRARQLGLLNHTGSGDHS